MLDRPVRSTFGPHVHDSRARFHDRDEKRSGDSEIDAGIRITLEAAPEVRDGRHRSIFRSDRCLHENPGVGGRDLETFEEKVACGAGRERETFEPD